jgi:hypothetical protein
MSYIKANEITPHVTDEQPLMDAFMIGGAGDVDCRFRGDSADVTLTGLQVGKIYPFQLQYIRATSGATDMVSFISGRMAT